MNDSLQAKVSRLRQIIADAVPAEPPKGDAESEAWQRFQNFTANDPIPAFDTSLRARRIRNVNRIAISYGWIREIQHFLDQREAPSIQSLGDDELEAMHQHFMTLETCYREGCDLPDGPHAR
ncbi:MAG TPA: hypothetical protein VKZ46_03335 [Pedomonas sp.]|nr:hypothetical protein [Pedomonas sp.]